MKLKLGDGLQIPIEVAGQAVALVGIRGSGKTNTAGVIAEELLDRGQQIVVLDPTDAWWGLRSDYPVFIFGGPHGDLPLNETDGKTLAEFVVQEKVPVILSLRHLRKGAQRRLVTEFCEELYHLKGRPEYREPLTVFIDEAPQFVPQRVMGEMARLVGAVQDMILLGRSAGFGVVMISQRFATLNADVRTQADTVIVHRLPSPLDRKALTEWIEENATLAEQKDVLSSLAKLATGEAWVWSPFFDLFKRSQIRARKTFDSSAAPKRDGVVRVPKDLKKIDIAKLKGKLSEAIEKAKADDPRELRKHIAELKKENARILSLPAAKENKHLNRVEVLTDADRALLEKVVVAVTARVDQARGTISVADQRLEQAVQKAAAEYLNTVRQVGMDAALHVEATLDRAGLKKILDKLSALSPEPPAQDSRRPAVSRAVPPTGRSSAATRPNETRAPRGTDGSGAAGDASIGDSGLRRMLVALAQRNGLTKRQLAIRTGMAASGGSFRTYLSRGRTNGWIAGDAQRIEITEAGIAAVGSYDPLPEGAELQAHWLREMGNSGAAAILRALCDVYPNAMTKDELSAATNMAVAGGSFRTYLSRLRTLELITGHGDELRASEELFS